MSKIRWNRVAFVAIGFVVGAAIATAITNLAFGDAGLTMHIIGLFVGGILGGFLASRL